ncbi:Vitamin K epoxide reductase [Desulfurella amilsii]|uniref:Vitamin K epoxide reductase n=1 Tax=Desulfurella amilsii TaxID=1562698 RepID=A0A1X4XZU9_9BACT|nr:glutaredoxin domain-containing protein [Desulfurella amilsii]OSS43023.1 Vitamin K epoxide reductase [Desulfurella amilsii]
MKRIAIYLLGFVLSFIELVLAFFHKSLCEAYACKLVASYVKYGEFVLILTGVIVFFILTLLELSRFNFKDYLIDAILIAALSTEGLLLSFQIFSLKVICYFCFSIFLIFLIIVVWRLLEKHYSMFFAILGFLSVFCIGFFIMPNLSPLRQGYDLFYSKTCPHCEKTISFLRNSHINVNLYDAQDYKNFLNNIGIDEVPVLFVNLKDQKRFVIGEENIQKYFSQSSQNSNYNFFNKNQTCIIGDNCTK